MSYPTYKPPLALSTKAKVAKGGGGGVFAGHYGSYIPQTKQHQPKGQLLFRLGNVTYLLDGYYCSYVLN